MRIKQSICYPIFHKQGQPLDGLFETWAGYGGAAVELWGWGDELDGIAATARKYKLAVASICGHGSLGDGLNKRSNHDRIEKELRKAIDKAAGLGIPGLICFSGNRQPHMGELEAIDACADGLRRVASYAEKKGVNLNVELLNSKIDHAGYQCDHTAWGVAVCEKVASPRVKLLFDIYHMQIMEGDVIRNLRENIQWIGHFHTAGVPGRHEMDDTQELNYRGICKAIAASGYEYYLGHEFAPTGEAIAALKQAFEICDQG